MAGYSGTPLIKKLGIKAGQRACILGAPPGYLDLLGELPENLVLVSCRASRTVWILFTFSPCIPPNYR